MQIHCSARYNSPLHPPSPISQHTHFLWTWVPPVPLQRQSNKSNNNMRPQVQVWSTDDDHHHNLTWPACSHHSRCGWFRPCCWKQTVSSYCRTSGPWSCPHGHRLVCGHGDLTQLHTIWSLNSFILLQDVRPMIMSTWSSSGLWS